MSLDKVRLLNNKKYVKMELYCNGINKFISSQNNNFTQKNFTLDENIIGILFLTEMNRYCKNSNISLHGYYVGYSLINIYHELIKNLMLNKKIDYSVLIMFYNNLACNIDYINSRVDKNKKINTNKIILEITPLLDEILFNNGVKKYCISNLIDEKNDIILYNKNNDENNNKKVLQNFFYIILILAKSIITNECKDANLYKLSEYYANIFYIFLELMYNVHSNDYQKYYDTYNDYKCRLIYAILELNINSSTLEEIIDYLDTNIIDMLTKK